MERPSLLPNSGRVTERQLQQAIVDTARLLGWIVYHTHDSRRSEPGFPDLVLVRDRVVYAELKRTGGHLSPAQQRWIQTLRSAGAEVHVWKPCDWTGGTVEQTLRRRVVTEAAV